jgi:hypothetical protein
VSGPLPGNCDMPDPVKVSMSPARCRLLLLRRVPAMGPRLAAAGLLTHGRAALPRFTLADRALPAALPRRLPRHVLRHVLRHLHLVHATGCLQAPARPRCLTSLACPCPPMPPRR